MIARIRHTIANIIYSIGYELATLIGDDAWDVEDGEDALDYWTR